MHDVELAGVAALIGNASRSAMLDALLSGRALTAGELARVAGIGPPAASEHLARLVDGALVEAVAAGRHRYYRLAGPEVAAALESLALIAPARPIVGLRQAGHARALGYARSCYDHLAGTTGVRLHDALVSQEWIRPVAGGYEATASGADRFADLGVDIGGLQHARRPFARACLDWTERRDHLAGALAATLLDRMLEQRWVVRRAAESRALRVTAQGESALAAIARGHHAVGA